MPRHITQDPDIVGDGAMSDEHSMSGEGRAAWCWGGGRVLSPGTLTGIKAAPIAGQGCAPLRVLLRLLLYV